MKIILQTLALRNFKGIEKLDINFSDNTNILGANESGKSTLCTAFTWLLTGKDEFDRKDYEIKNTKVLERNSHPHEVEGIFIVDGRELKLRRVYLEKWTKPRGKAEKEFEGHYTDYFQNDVPCSASEYQTKVDAIIPANIIKLITNPTYFNSLKWQDQRRGLVSIAGEITNDEVIAKIATPANNFADLVAALNNRKYAGLDDYRKHIQSKKKLLKDKAEQYQPRIQEVNHNTPEGKDWNRMESDILILKGKITGIDDQLSDSLSALKVKQEAITSLQKDLFGAEQKLTAIKNRIRSDVETKQRGLDTEITSLRQRIKSGRDNISSIQAEVAAKQNNIKAYQQEIVRLEGIIEGHRTTWGELNNRSFSFDEQACTCPTCLQTLPEGQVEERKAELRANFNRTVAEGKQEQVDKSNARKKELADQKDLINAANGVIFSLENEIVDIELQVKVYDGELASLLEAASKKAVPDIDAAILALLANNGDALNLQDEIADLNKKIQSQTVLLGEQTDSAALKSERAELQGKIDDLNTLLNEKITIEKMALRLDELKREEAANAQEIALLERQEYEIETFIRAQMDILEARVNDMFAHVSFRLFEKQVNGGIAETCVCEYKGVPYPTLNTAAKMLAGLDVIETFSRYHNIYAPVFCDNRESVSFIPEIQSQIISLFVSPAHTALKVEAA